MNFPFRHEITVAGVRIGSVSGTLVLEANPEAPSACGHFPAWTVDKVLMDGIRAQGRRVEAVCVEMRDGHPLYDGMLLELLNGFRHEIDQAWAVHGAQMRWTPPVAPRNAPPVIPADAQLLLRP